MNNDVRVKMSGIQASLAIAECAVNFIRQLREGSDALRVDLLRQAWEQHANEHKQLSLGVAVPLEDLAGNLAVYRVLDTYFKFAGNWGRMMRSIEDDMMEMRSELYRFETIHGVIQHARGPATANPTPDGG